jgi:hypothetical protein
MARTAWYLRERPDGGQARGLVTPTASTIKTVFALYFAAIALAAPTPQAGIMGGIISYRPGDVVVAGNVTLPLRPPGVGGRVDDASYVLLEFMPIE